MITQLSLVPSKKLTQRQAPISPQEPVSAEKNTAPEKLEGGLKKVGLMTDSLRPPRDTKEWFCVDFPSQTDSESRSTSSRDNSPENSQANSQANSPMKCSQSTTSSPREICLPPPLLSLPPLSPPRKADKSSSSNSSTPFNKSSFQPTLAGVESASNGLPTPPPSENCDPSFIRTMPPEVIFDVFFSYLTPDETVDVLSVVNEYQNDIFFDYREKQGVREDRFNPEKHCEESRSMGRCFYEIEALLKNYSTRVSKQFFINLPPELLKELRGKLTPQLNDELNKELSNKSPSELSQEVSKEFRMQVSSSFSSNSLPDQLNKLLSQEFYKMLPINTLKKLIYDYIGSCYIAFKKGNCPILDVDYLGQFPEFGNNEELLSKIFYIFADCEIPSFNIAHKTAPIDFRVSFFATIGVVKNMADAIFGSILTNDFSFLEYVLNNPSCSSDNIINGVADVCCLFDGWVDYFHSYFDYRAGKTKFKPQKAYLIEELHGKHFLNSFYHSRAYIKYAIYKAAELRKKEEMKKEYKKMISKSTYEGEFVPNFNRFKAAYSNKASLIRKWETFHKVKFIPSPLPEPLQDYIWKWFDNFALRFRVWQNSTSKH